MSARFLLVVPERCNRVRQPVLALASAFIGRELGILVAEPVIGIRLQKVLFFRLCAVLVAVVGR